MKYSEKRKKNAAKILAFILIGAMLVTSAFYILMLFANDRALSAFAVYGADAEEEVVDDRFALERLDDLRNVIDFIHDYYKDPVTYDELVDAVYSGLVDSLGDPWSVYYVSQKESDSFVQTINQQYSGVGVTMTMDNGSCLISGVNHQGPAYEAGIRSGSYIVKVDGASVAEWTLSEISEKVRGEEGTAVVLTIRENGVDKDYRLIRRQLKNATVECELLDNNIGYISITSFGEDTPTEFREAKLKLFGQGANCFIIDIRDNGGGYVSSAVDMADELLDEGVLSRFVWRGEDIAVYEATPNSFRKAPVVLLVNGNTASASEIFAAALHDNGAATLVGTKTYGKGVAQLIEPLDNNASIKLSVYYFNTPNGEAINGVGLTPDYLVSAVRYEGEEAEAIRASVVDMAENRRYHAGEFGLNVLAAQQRLHYLGYDVDCNGYMDKKTLAAIKAFQPTFGGIGYGGLDFCTQKALCEAFDALFVRTDADPQLAKAIELLSQ